MFNHYQNTKIAELHGEELRRVAEHQQIADALPQEEARPFYAPALTVMGQKLVELGSALEARYGEVRREHDHAEQQALADLNPNMAALQAK